MKNKRYSHEQIIGILKAHEAGAKVGDLVRKHGISEQSFYRWKSKYGAGGLRGASIEGTRSRERTLEEAAG